MDINIKLSAIMQNDELDGLSEEDISELLCKFIDDMCIANNIKPIEFTWNKC